MLDLNSFKPGQKVAVTQQIPQRDEVWVNTVRGEIVKAEQAKTGSWFARSKDDRLWLDRLTVRKDDGEIVTFNLDRYTHVDVLTEPVVKEDAPAAENAQDEDAPGDAATEQTAKEVPTDE